MRERAADFLQLDVAALGDGQGAREHVGRVLEDAHHLVVALHVELVALELQPARILDGLARLYADHHVLGVGVLFAEIVAVVGRDQRNAGVLAQAQQVGADLVLLLQALVLNLEEEILCAEELAEEAGSLARGVVLPFRQALGDFALQAAGKPDQPARVLGEKFLADARLVVEAVERRLGGDLHQVAVALVGLGEHDQVVVVIAVGRRAVHAVVVLLADVELAADDGLDAVLLGGIVEMQRAEDVAVVGDGDGRLPELGHARHELVDVAGAIEQRVIGVQVKMDKLGHERRYLYSNGCGFRQGGWKTGVRCGKRTSVARTRLSVVQCPGTRECRAQPASHGGKDFLFQKPEFRPDVTFPWEPGTRLACLFRPEKPICAR